MSNKISENVERHENKTIDVTYNLIFLLLLLLLHIVQRIKNKMSQNKLK